MNTRVLTTTRNSSVESLRIIAMLMIVCSHACIHGGFSLEDMPFSLNKLFVQWGILGNLGVDIFVLISGYFMSQKPFQLKFLSKLYAQVWFYSISLFLLCWLVFGCDYTNAEMLPVLFPVIFGEYWFFTAYIILLIMNPGINHFVEKASEQLLKKTILCALLLWVVIPTFTAQKMYSDVIPQFVLFYLVGAYLRKYPDNCFRVKWLRNGMTAISFMLLFLSTVVFGLFENTISAFAGRGTYFYERNSLLIVGCAVGLFAMAVYHKPFSNPLVNRISGCTFGVYLIHENPMIRKLLWLEWVDNSAYVQSPLLPLRILVSIAVVYIASTIIEYLRQKTLAGPMEKVFYGVLRWGAEKCVSFGKMMQKTFLKFTK